MNNFSWRSAFTIIAYLISIVAFVLIGGYAILFASGYKIDLEKGTLEKTGIISVSSSPNKAELYVNNQKVASPTPSSAKGLLPGTYQVKVRKDGTKPYVNEGVAVRPGRVTDLDVLLFNQDLVEQSSLPSFLADEIVWQNGEAMIFRRDSMLFFFEPGTDPHSIADLSSLGVSGWNVEDIMLSPDANQALARLARGRSVEYLLLNISETGAQRLPSLSDAEETVWRNNNEIAFTSEMQARVINLNTGEITQLESTDTATESVAGFEGDLYVFQSSENGSVSLHDLSGNQIAEELPLANRYTLLSRDPLVLALRTDLTSTLWARPSEDESFVKVAGSVGDVIRNDEYLAYTSQDQLWRIELEAPENELFLADRLDSDTELLMRQDYVFYRSDSGDLDTVYVEGGTPQSISDRAVDQMWIDSDTVIGYLLRNGNLTAYKLRDDQNINSTIEEFLLRNNSQSF